jgi:hypothetical protein
MPREETHVLVSKFVTNKLHILNAEEQFMMHGISSLFNACKIAKRALQSASNDLYALMDQSSNLNSFEMEAKTLTPRDLRKKIILTLHEEKISLSKIGGGMVNKYSIFNAMKMKKKK